MRVTYSSPWTKSPAFDKLYGNVKHRLMTMSSSDGKYFAKALRTTLIVLFTLQLVSTLERQVFDFLGYMWAPIIGNFFQIVVVILGLFGACYFYRSFIVLYSVWNLLWLGWNVFVICIYLEVGILNRNRNRYILTIGTEGKSWWLEHGIGCKVTDGSFESEEEDTDTDLSGGRKIPPEEAVVGCILQYYYVEVIHAAVQCLLSLLGFVAASVSIYMSADEEYQMSSANDELEFVKMRYRTPTHVSSAHDDERENMAFYNLNLTTEFPDDPPPPRSRRERVGSREQPPSYDTTMRNMDAVGNNFYAGDRQSVRSKASTRSKRSTHRNVGGGAGVGGDSSTYSEARNLPWVQITPSTTNDNPMLRHYP